MDIHLPTGEQISDWILTIFHFGLELIEKECFMPPKIFYAIVFCLVGCVSAAEKFWTYTPGEGIAFETVQGQVSLLTPTWQQVSEMEMIRKKQLTYHFFENEPQKFRCRIIFQRSSPIPAACLGFGIVLPLKTPARTYDGKRLVLPEHYK